MDTLTDTRPAARKSDQAARLALVLLSNVRLVRADGEAFVLAGKAAAVLCLAALGGGISRAQAAALLWPTASEQVARTNLRVLSHRLHRQHGCALLSGSDRLELDATSLELQLPTVEEAIDSALIDSSPQWQLLGDLNLDGLPEWTQWLRQQQEMMSRQWDEAFSIHFDRCAVKGQWHLAGQAAQARLRLSPLSESAHRQVMSLHLQAGDRATALMAYERCREVLSEELGVSPSPLTRVLHSQILRMPTTLPTRGEPEAWMFHSPAIVAREQQLLDMNRSWGQEHNLLVCGEGGTGKTRLVREFLRGRRALLVSIRPSDCQVPYAALARILRALPSMLVASIDESVRRELARVVPEWGSAQAHVADRSSFEEWRLCEAVMSCIAHLVVNGLTELAVEDIHHADTRSLELLIRLLDHDAPNGMRMLFSSRPDARSALFSALLCKVIVERRADLVRVPPLDHAGVRAMLEELPLPWLRPSVHAAPLHVLSGGYPMLVLEILRESARSPQPGQFHGMDRGLKPLMQARVERCSGLARGLLHLALVAEAAFCVALAANVMKLSAPLLADPWRELERAGLFNRQGISHHLVTEALGDSVPDAIRADMHRQVAAWMTSQGGDPIRIVHHLLEADLHGEAMPHAIRAADQLNRLGLAEDALGLMFTVLRPDQDHPLSSDMWVLFGNIDNLIPYVVGDARLPPLLALMKRQAHRPEHHALTALAHATFHYWQQRFSAAEHQYRLARTLAEPGASVWIRSRFGLARSLTLLMRVSEAREVLQDLPPTLDDVGSNIDPLSYHMEMAWVRNMMADLAEATRHLLQTRRLARMAGSPGTTIKLLESMSRNLRGRGAVRAAARGTRRALELAQRQPKVGSQLPMLMLMNAIHEMHDGNYTLALHLLDSLLAELPPESMTRMLAELMLMRLYLQCGQTRRAVVLLDELAAPDPNWGQKPDLYRTLESVPVQMAVGRDVVPALRALRDQIGSDDLGVEYTALVLLEARALTCADQRWACARQALAQAQARGALGQVAEAHLLIARAAHEVGSHAEAQAHARDAAHHLRRARMQVSTYPPEQWLWCADLLKVCEPEMARRMLLLALQWIAHGARHLPPAFMQTFVQAHAVNRQVAALAHELNVELVVKTVD